jgi:hypothetical protein
MMSEKSLGSAKKLQVFESQLSVDGLEEIPELIS